MRAKTLLLLSALFLILSVFGLSAQHDEGHGDAPHGESVVSESCAHHDDEGYDPVGTVMDHIKDANEIHLFGEGASSFSIPLPIFLYAPGHGWTVTNSTAFHHGHTSVDGYVLNHGRVNRIADESFPHMEGEAHIECIVHKVEVEETASAEEEAKEKNVYYAVYHGKEYRLDAPSIMDGGILGGGNTSFYDFSITKNVAFMMLAALLLIIIWTSVAAGYRRNEGKAPSGIQSFMEPFFVFIRDEVTIPMIGEKHYERFQPFIMTIFFFVLFCNLLGLIPLIGSPNITGNLAVTLALAIFTFLVTNFNGNRHYWEHTLWMPGVPIWVKPVLAIVEGLGLFIKPFSLMVRLFANITAGHIIILSLIGLIFLFGNNGENVGGAAAGGVVGGLFTIFMSLIELLVAFLQAFIFAILSASYIGAAVEEGHDHDHDHEHESTEAAVATA